MQIKTTMRYHLTPVRMHTKSLQTINAGKCVEKGNALALLVGTKIDTAAIEDGMDGMEIP